MKLKVLFIITIFLFNIQSINAKKEKQFIAYTDRFVFEPIESYGCTSGTYRVSIRQIYPEVAYTIDHVEWNMGDNSQIQITSDKRIIYTYSNNGTFNISAKVFVNNTSSTGVQVQASMSNSSTFIPVTVDVSDINLSISSNGLIQPNILYDVMINYSTSLSSSILSGGYQLLLDGNVIYESDNSQSFPESGTIIRSLSFTPGEHSLSILLIRCNRSISLDVSTNSCLECYQFKPDPGKRYWVSAWAREDIGKVINYPNVAISIDFLSNSSTIISTVSFNTTGEIVEGWQRIVGDFIVPTSTSDIQINLSNENGTGAAYFDDIRIHPFNASMKSYVYDPQTFLLSAELDDNNYSTFYEYDNEGQLIRIKKETARGIMTIQESRSSNPKKL